MTLLLPADPLYEDARVLRAEQLALDSLHRERLLPIDRPCLLLSGYDLFRDTRGIVLQSYRQIRSR